MPRLNPVNPETAQGKAPSQALSAIVIASALLLSAQPANAQQVCAPHEKAALQLEEKFDEQVIGRGLTPNGKAMFELFVSESGSWTVIVSEPSGRSCVVAIGESWQRIPVLVGDPA